MFCGTSYQLIMSIVFGLMSVVFLGISLRGLVARRPFLFPAGWIFVFMLVCFSPQMFVPLIMFQRGVFQPAHLFSTGMFVFIIYIFWRQMRGYIILGITENTLREALLSSLRKLGLGYEETLSVVKLPNGAGEIVVTMQGGMGTAIIRGRALRDPGLLASVAEEMGHYFKENPVETNSVIFILYLMIGLVFLAVPSVINSTGWRLRSMSARICPVKVHHNWDQEDIPPQLTNPATIEDYRVNYLEKGDHRAFAYSSDGPYGYCYNQKDEEQAQECALGYCNKYRKEGQAPCGVISLDGEQVAVSRRR